MDRSRVSKARRLFSLLTYEIKTCTCTGARHQLSVPLRSIGHRTAMARPPSLIEVACMEGDDIQIHSWQSDPAPF